MLKIPHIIYIFTALITLSLGVLIGTGQWQIILILIALLVMVVLSLINMRYIEDRSGSLLVMGWCVMLITNYAQKISGVPLGYVLEAVIFGLAFTSLRKVWQLTAQDPTLRLLITLLLIYFSLALLSSVLGRSHNFAALWQLQYNLKWPLMFGLGCLIVWTEHTDQILQKIVAWSWLFIVPFVAIEIISPSLYTQLFLSNVGAHTNPLLGIGIRYRGPFSHSGMLAITCALMAICAVVQLLRGKGRSWFFIALIYIAFVLASGQRQEMSAMLIAILLICIISWRHYWSLLLVSILFSGLFIFSGFYLDDIPMRSTLEQWGLFNNLSTLSERAILTSKGIDVALQYFPLGSGLGTYGGAGALKFDQSLFVDLGFGQYYWFREGKFLVDTYWPSIVAESGFFGGLLILTIYLVIFMTLLRRAWYAKGTPVFGLVLIAIAAMTLLLANTPTSAIITDPRGAFFFWLLIGAAWRATSVSDTNMDIPLNENSKKISQTLSKVFKR